jgi:hypothetical protein
MEFIISLLMKTIIEIGYLIGIIIIIGLILGFLRKHTLRNFQRSFGSKILMITGVIGVPIHELSHAVIALLFGHKITKIKFLQKPDENGVMGYVSHSYNKRNIYQQAGNFFIGIAPIFGATFVILALLRLMLPQAYGRYVDILVNNLQVTELNGEFLHGLLGSYVGLVKAIFGAQNFENPYFYLFLFITICISSHISLSHADIKGALNGLVILFLILLIANLFDVSKHIMTINLIKYNIFLTGILSISILLSVVTFFTSLIIRLKR